MGVARDYLFDYLSIDVDPYDFAHYLPEWFRDTDEVDPTEYVEELGEAKLERFKKWLIDNKKGYEYADEMPYESPAYLHMSAEKKLPRGTWCAHFSNSPFDRLEYGATIEGLHLSTWRRDRKSAPAKCPDNLSLDRAPFEVVYGFAYLLSSFRDVREPASKYGRYIILFQTDEGILAHHYGDEEKQVIFPLCSEYNVRHIVFDSASGQVVAQTHGGREVPFPSVPEVVRYVETKRKKKADDLKGMGSMASTVIDEGSFNNATLAKAGHDLVREGLSIEGAAATQPLAVEDYESKYCQATKGGKMPECRVHVTSANGTSMALRLCDKVDGDGTVVPVKDAADALATARKFCKCARNKPVGVRAKCARKMPGALNGIGDLSTSAMEMFTPPQAAANMVKRYGAQEPAAQHAQQHAMQYPRGDPRRVYWESVDQLIKRGVH